MVNAISHFGLGLLIASAAGYTDRRRKWIIGIMALLPDLDAITTILFIFLDSRNVINSENYRLFYILLMHRELSHSLIFIIVPTLVLWLKEKKDLKIAGFGALAMGSHIFIDSATWWGMRNLWPLSSNGSSLGIVDYNDPVVNLTTLLIVLIFLITGSDKLKELIPKISGYLQKNEDRIAGRFLAALTLWLLIACVLKAAMIYHVEREEGVDIQFLNTGGQAGIGRAFTAYDHNETHFRVLEISYWGGVEKGKYVAKYNHTLSQDNFTLENSSRDHYVNRTLHLYGNSLVRELEFIVVTIEENDTILEITLSDAREEVIGGGQAWFSARYRFVFDKNETRDNIGEADFKAYRTMFELGGEEVTVPAAWFV